MQNYFLLTGLLAAFLFFLIDKNLMPGTLIAKKQLLQRFERNKQKDMQLRLEFQNLVGGYNAWSFTAFPYSDVTYEEYIGLLSEKSGMEYADAEFENIKSRSLNRRETADYLEKIKGQEDALEALKADLHYQKNNFRQIALMTAS